METALRSVGRGVGHTHGCVRALGEAAEEQESGGRAEGRVPLAALGLLKKNK